MTSDDRLEQLSAFTDGELHPAAMAELTRHLVTCSTCARRLAELGEVRSALAQTFQEEEVSKELLSRITMSLDQPESITRDKSNAGARIVPFKRHRITTYLGIVGSSMAASALAATVALMLMRSPKNIVDLAAVRDASFRSSLTAYTVEQEKPVAVAGYHVTSVKDDIVAGHEAQVVAYEGGPNVVTLCTWKAHGEPAHGVETATYRGTMIMYWNDGTNEYWAVSIDHDEGLKAFVRSARKDAI